MFMYITIIIELFHPNSLSLNGDRGDSIIWSYNLPKPITNPKARNWKKNTPKAHLNYRLFVYFIFRCRINSGLAWVGYGLWLHSILIYCIYRAPTKKIPLNELINISGTCRNRIFVQQRTQQLVTGDNVAVFFSSFGSCLWFLFSKRFFHFGAFCSLLLGIIIEISLCSIHLSCWANGTRIFNGACWLMLTTPYIFIVVRNFIYIYG